MTVEQIVLYRELLELWQHLATFEAALLVAQLTGFIGIGGILAVVLYYTRRDVMDYSLSLGVAARRLLLVACRRG